MLWLLGYALCTLSANIWVLQSSELTQTHVARYVGQHDAKWMFSQCAKTTAGGVERHEFIRTLIDQIPDAIFDKSCDALEQKILGVKSNLKLKGDEKDAKAPELELGGVNGNSEQRGCCSDDADCNIM